MHILGIRHHGPGSARNVRKALEQIKPDCILIEGPPDADALIEWAAKSEMKPPVALLLYNPENPQQAVFYPFSEYSPEWQAMTYATAKNINVRFMDLPFAHQCTEEETTENEQFTNEKPNSWDALAHAAGFEEGEEAWEQIIEYRQDTNDIFEAVAEAFIALRTKEGSKDVEVYSKREALREAYMRKIIRQAEKEGFENIVVICGAWHVPALQQMPSQKHDDELLKKLPQVKIDATWIPWTNSRLAWENGYGAGVTSPGWYAHIWKYPKDNGVIWLSKVAKTLRQDKMDVSVAHIIETQRLAEHLAIIRNVPRVGLTELNEAIVSVIGMGDDMILRLVKEKLIVGNKIGAVPSDAPKIPLQLNVELLQKKLKLKPSATREELILDLRKPLDLERSVFLHRLHTIGIDWGRKTQIRTKGTFKESWVLEWTPELLIKVIEKGIWGNTVETAATNYVLHIAEEADLAQVTDMLEKVIPAQLPDLLQKLMQCVENLSATTSDVLILMQAIPPLANISRYGDVRKTDTDLILNVVKSLVLRTCIGLPSVCFSLDENAANQLNELLLIVNQSIILLQDENLITTWQTTLRQIMDMPNTNALIAGTNCRLLIDAKALTEDEAATYFSVALSIANEATFTAAWLEGFLKGSGTILLLDDRLWNLVDAWVEQLNENVFIPIIPLLRRTFSTFQPAERQKIGEKAKFGTNNTVVNHQLVSGVNDERGASALAVIDEILFSFNL